MTIINSEKNTNKIRVDITINCLIIFKDNNKSISLELREIICDTDIEMSDNPR